ncbi:hypothetical protein [Simkania sp.]|uniref:hypothetical protein n=1 Tax=Simkania sp. TaxID=34094 RepID=UPI003B518B15
MSTVTKENYNLVGSQDAAAATDAINEQIVDQTVAAMADGSDFESKTQGPSDEQIDDLIDTVNKILDQGDEQTYELSSGKNVMLQLIAALQKSQSKESQASNVVQEAHSATSLANAKAQASDYKQDIKDMSKKHHWWHKVAAVAKKSVPYAMIVVGVVTEQPEFIVAGSMSLLMKTQVVSGMTDALASKLQECPGLKNRPELAHVIASAITVLAITVVTGGVSFGVGGLEMVAEEGATELGDAAAGELSTTAEEQGTHLNFNTEKAVKKGKTGAKLGFSMSLASQSTTFSKAIASLVPEDDKLARRMVFVISELIIMVASMGVGYSGLSDATAAESEGTSAFSKLSEQASKVLGEDAGNIINKVGNVVDFVAKNSKIITSALMIMTGLANITLSAGQMSYANTEAALGSIQSDLAILSSAESINEAGIDQETQDLKNFVSAFLTEEKFAQSMVDARNYLSQLLAR